MRKIIQPCGFHCIKINHLGVQFGEQVILEDVNLHIHCGTLNAIIGKNGAGKTTLFTAMRLCLYGFMSMGYKNANSHYTRAITKLINNSAKMKKPAMASVTMKIALSNGQELDYYELCRSWVLSDSLRETFTVVKNGEVMNSEEIADFEKYLLSLIPPELFNLYFFDGEKIADFFME